MWQKVLIIDDDKEDQDIIKIFLKRAGWSDFYVADSGEEGLEQAVSLKPDIVIIDTNLPGINGYETCKLIRAAAENKDIKIIIITGLIDVVDAGRARKAGADEYCVKTTDCKPLIEILRNIKTTK